MVGYHKIAERNGGCVIPYMKVALAPPKSIFLKVSGFYFIFLTSCLKVTDTSAIFTAFKPHPILLILFAAK